MTDTAPATPEGYGTINPFLITRNVDGLIAFVADVFGGVEDPMSRTMDNDGLLLHAEVAIPGGRMLFAERKPGWAFTPSLLQVYVDDLDATLARAQATGGEVITTPTDFFGDGFSRVLDPWKNMWWIYQHNPATAVDWSAADAGDAASWGGEGGEDAAWSEADAGWSSTPEMEYLHQTLIDHFPRIQDQ